MRRAELRPEAYESLRERWFEKLLGPDRDDIPTSSHTSYLRRLSPLAETYTKERAVPVCVETLAKLGFDLEQIPGIRPTSTTGRRSHRVVRDRVRPAQCRAPDHACAGWLQP